ncbi:MAG: OmpA family protein [Gemmatimonadota bacterium]|jgi:outer membrane protein OmpA-like peptidoglycan-associated protein|nr:OmpA family protein [Gemmatimonadota bacterium]MDP6802259.1 OmpA family protein [Gemmatimonadota bacterium]MDP7032303.1 OmpA family protein [Gemmatimonadota bacterium]
MRGTRTHFSVPVVAFLSLWVAVASAASPVPSMDGVRGMFRIHAADSAIPGTATATFTGLYTQEWYSSVASPRGRSERARLGAGLLGLGYAVSPSLELGFRASVESQQVVARDSDDEASALGVGAYEAHLKHRLLSSRSGAWSLGAGVSVGTASGNGRALLGEWDRSGVDLTGRLALTLAPPRGSRGAGARVHMNAGYRSGTGGFDETAQPAINPGDTPSRLVPHGDRFLYGVGMEIPGPGGFDFLAECTGEYDVNESEALPVHSMRITPAVRWTQAVGLFAWTAGVDVRLSEEGSGPDWQAVTSFAFGSHLAPLSGVLLGSVRHGETGDPVPGVRIVARNRDTPPTWSDEDGRFRLDIREGYTVLEMERDGFVPRTRVVEAPAGGETEVSCTIVPRMVFGRVTGRVLDSETGEPLPARVEVAGAGSWAEADPESGTYAIERVREGDVNLMARAEGYDDAHGSTRVVAGESSAEDLFMQRTQPAQHTEREVSLTEGLPAGAPVWRVAPEGIRFESGTATILPGTVASLESVARMLLENDGVHVHIEGHTDDIGPANRNLALSQRRADAVMKALVVNFGVDPDRLSALGVGEIEPVEDNSSPENRARNRRIEFRVRGGRSAER